MIFAAAMLACGIALVVWTVLGDHGMRWGVIGSVLVGFAAVEAYVALLDDEQRRPVRGMLYLLTPLLSGGIFAAVVTQERPDPVAAPILAHDSSAVGIYGKTALTWGFDGLHRTTDGRGHTIGKQDDPDTFFHEPVVATEEVVIDVRGDDVRAYDPVSGERIWARSIPHVTAFRAFSDVLVYDGDGKTGALDISTGRDLWRRNGDATLGRGGLALTGTDSAWDLNGTASLVGLIEQDRYVGVRVNLHRLDVVEVATGKTVRSQPMGGFVSPYAIAGESLYLVRDGKGLAVGLDTDAPARPIVVKPGQEVGIEDVPGFLFESKYPGLLGAMPDGWASPDDVSPRVDRDKHGSPAFPVTSGDAQGVWFTTTPEVVRLEDSFDTLIAYGYDRGTYVQLVSDHDAVGRSYTRLDVVRDGAVTSRTMPSDNDKLGKDDGDEALSVRDGLVCVSYACRSVDDLLG